MASTTEKLKELAKDPSKASELGFSSVETKPGGNIVVTTNDGKKINVTQGAWDAFKSEPSTKSSTSSKPATGTSSSASTSAGTSTSSGTSSSGSKASSSSSSSSSPSTPSSSSSSSTSKSSSSSSKSSSSSSGGSQVTSDTLDAQQKQRAALINQAIASGQITPEQVLANARSEGVDLAQQFGRYAVTGVYTPAQQAIANTSSGSGGSSKPDWLSGEVTRQLTPDAEAALQKERADLINYAISTGKITPEQVLANAKSEGVDLAEQFGQNEVQGVYTPAQKAVAATAKEKRKAEEAVEQQAPAVEQQPAFEYLPSGYRLSEEDAKRLAQAQARLAYGYQEDAINRELQRILAGYDQSAKAIPQFLEEALARNDEEAARAGFYTSGRRFALRDQSQQEAVQRLADIEDAKNRARQEAADRLLGIARDEGLYAASQWDALRRDDRDYALRERAQQFAEYDANRNYALNAADMNAILALRALELEKGRALLPYEIEAAGLQNAAALANYYDTYSPSGLGYQTRNAQLESILLGNQAAQASLWDTYNPAGLGYQTRNAQLESLLLGNEAQRNQNKIAAIQADVAANPEYGLKAQAALQMEEQRSRINQINTEISRAASGTNSYGLTPYQVYQILKDQDKATEEDLDRAAQDVESVFDVSRMAAKVWIELSDAINLPKENGQPMTEREAKARARDVGRSYGLSSAELDWLTYMVGNVYGNQSDWRELDKFRRANVNSANQFNPYDQSTY